jgi:selenoprotein W-related protein
LANFEPEIESITLIPSQGGRFEVMVNEDLLYSKLKTGRHVLAGEVVGLVKKYLMK